MLISCFKVSLLICFKFHSLTLVIQPDGVSTATTALQANLFPQQGTWLYLIQDADQFSYAIHCWARVSPQDQPAHIPLTPPHLTKSYQLKKKKKKKEKINLNSFSLFLLGWQHYPCIDHTHHTEHDLLHSFFHTSMDAMQAFYS